MSSLRREYSAIALPDKLPFLFASFKIVKTFPQLYTKMHIFYLSQPLAYYIYAANTF